MAIWELGELLNQRNREKEILKGKADLEFRDVQVWPLRYLENYINSMKNTLSCLGFIIHQHSDTVSAYHKVKVKRTKLQPDLTKAELAVVIVKCIFVISTSLDWSY